MAQRSIEYELLRPFLPSGRVFILGAGASIFAGFPLGPELYSFLIDHAEATISLKWLVSYVESLPRQKRSEAISDIEQLLTKVEQGEIPDYLDRAPVSLQGHPGAWEALLPAMRHSCANCKPSGTSLQDYVESELKILTTGIKAWQMDDFIDCLSRAFLAHHACLLHAGRHFYGARYKDPLDLYNIPSAFGESPSGRCPCARRHGWRRQKRRIEAVARKFRPGDCIVTFNWDVVMEWLLWSFNKWSPSDGYGLPVQFESSQLTHLDGKQRQRISLPSPIKVLKPHGSINWVNYVRDDSAWDIRRLGLRYLGLLFDLPIYSTYSAPIDQDPVDGPIGPDPINWKYTILTPTYNKDYQSEPFLSRIWEQISEVVEAASEITVIGYSLPPGDESARDQLGRALSRNVRCNHVDLVSPAGINDKHWRPFVKSVGKELTSGFATFEEWISS